MKGAFHAGPAIEPLRQMYMAAQVSRGRRIAHGIRTLVVGDRQNDEGQQQSPDAEAIEDGRDDAVGVELCNHMGDFGVSCGRDKARVDCHVDNAIVGVSARGGEASAARRRLLEDC